MVQVIFLIRVPNMTVEYFHIDPITWFFGFYACDTIIA